MSRTAIALAGLVLTLAGFVVGVFMGATHGRQEVQAKWDKATAAQAIATQQAEAKNRATEQAYQAAIDKEREDGRKKLEQVAADAAAAADQRVRTVAADYARRAAAKDSSAASGGASTALDLLAELLAGTDELAEKYAREADTSRVAGLACERGWDGLEVGR